MKLFNTHEKVPTTLKAFSKRLKLMVVLPATGVVLLSSAVPSFATDNTCKAVVITIGIGCHEQSPSSGATSGNPSTTPSPSSTPVDTSAAAPPAEAPETSPAPSPATTIIIKEVTVTPPAPSSTTQNTQAGVPPIPTVSNVASAAPKTSPPSLNGEQASVNGATPDFMKQAGIAAPYVFFIGLAGLIPMLIIARVKKLFPFDDSFKRDDKRH